MTDPRCLAWFLGLLLCWSAACGPAPSAEVHAARCVAIDVKRDDGTPLPGVAVRLGDGDALRTGVDGQVLVSLRPISSHVEVRAECPVGYRPSSARRLDLGPWTATERLSISFTCRPNQRSLGVAVLAPRAAGHAVLVDGLPIGQVAGDGTFHAVVERAPGTRLRVELDVRKLHLLDAQQELEVPDRDELVVLAPHPATAAVRSRPGPAPATGRSVGPYVPYAVHRARS
jgi:hypothetical protein